MPLGQFPKSPNKVDPIIPSAVASRNSLVWEGRSKKAEAKSIIDEASRYITQYTQTKLPPEVMKEVDVMAGLEDKIYNYINQAYVNMFNRYSITVEDEMIKKVRDFIDKEEVKTLARYVPKDIVDILDQVGGSDKFNTGEIEKSVVNMYGHLQGHIQRGVYDLEVETNAILRQKTDVGAFVRGENAYSIVKCAFKDNKARPKTVTDIKLSINILDSELISPIFHYQVTVEHLLKEQLSNHITDLIDREIDKVKEELVDTGRQEMSNSEIMFEKIKSTEKFTDDNVSDPNSRRYTILAKKFMDRIDGLRAEIDQDDYDPLNLREQIKSIIDSENIRNRGFNTAVNTLTSILDTSRLGYQFCDNSKNAREARIREYEDQEESNLPDERYAMTLVYYDQNQIRDLKRSYDQRITAYLREMDAVWDVVHVLYEKRKRKFGFFQKVVDFEDLARKLMPMKWKKERRELLNDEDELNWNGLQFRDPPNTFVEKNNRTYSVEVKNTVDKLAYLRNKLDEMYSYQNPLERVVLDGRMSVLEKDFANFAYEINPHQLQPGVLLDVNLTTTKRKQYIMKSMANVLNEFLHGISQGFADAAFASFKRRRSTVRADIAQSFEGDESGGPSMASAAYDGSSDSGGAPAGGGSSASPSGGSAGGVQGSADVTPNSPYDDKLKEMGLKEL